MKYYATTDYFSKNGFWHNSGDEFRDFSTKKEAVSFARKAKNGDWSKGHYRTVVADQWDNVVFTTHWSK